MEELDLLDDFDLYAVTLTAAGSAVMSSLNQVCPHSTSASPAPAAQYFIAHYRYRIYHVVGPL